MEKVLKIDRPLAEGFLSLTAPLALRVLKIDRPSAGGFLGLTALSGLRVVVSPRGREAARVQKVQKVQRVQRGRYRLRR